MTFVLLSNALTRQSSPARRPNRTLILEQDGEKNTVGWTNTHHSLDETEEGIERLIIVFL
jgi:hypothetical protein